MSRVSGGPQALVTRFQDADAGTAVIAVMYSSSVRFFTNPRNLTFESALGMNVLPLPGFLQLPGLRPALLTEGTPIPVPPSIAAKISLPSCSIHTHFRNVFANSSEGQ